MQPNYISLNKIFGPQTRYLVPLFQRPYVWRQEGQWEPLWDDVRALADRVLRAGPSGQVAGHFLGTAVLEQAPNPAGTIQCREVIDGQQRLTTLQILLHAAHHAISGLASEAKWSESDRKKLDVSARQVGFLTANPAFGEDEERYKVWPTNDDREAFRAVLDAGSPQDLSGATSLMAVAYRFFLGQVRSWLSGSEPPVRAEALASALGNHLRLIVLDLDNADEPQAIFETLNAHGTPLFPADLIKNKLLWEARKQELSIAELYDTYWHAFDKDPGFWRAPVGTGHSARPRIDILLQHWLTGRMLEVVPVKHLYERFLRYLSEQAVANEGVVPVKAVLGDIAADAANYRALATPTGHSRFDEFARRLSRMDVVVFDPVLLAVMRRPGSDDADRDRVAIALESYLVRRMICASQTRGYGTYALKLLASIDAVPGDQPVGTTVEHALLSEQDGTLAWPADDQFLSSWVGRQFYGNIRRDRVLMILQAIEAYYQTEGRLGEPVVTYDFSKLQIEHILPQTWRTEWAPPVGPNTEMDRDAKLHGIGNLTLVAQPLNATLSNAAWAYPDNPKRHGKRQTLAHSHLALNTRLVNKYAERWDEAAMTARALELFDVAVQLWPAPASFAATAVSVAARELLAAPK